MIIKILLFSRLVQTSPSPGSCTSLWPQTEAWPELCTATSTRTSGPGWRRSWPTGRLWTTSRSCAWETSPEPSSRGSSPSRSCRLEVRLEDCLQLSMMLPRLPTQSWLVDTSTTLASSSSTTTNLSCPMRPLSCQSTPKVMKFFFLLCIDERNSNPSKRKFMIKYLAFVK